MASSALHLRMVPPLRTPARTLRNLPTVAARNRVLSDAQVRHHAAVTSARSPVAEERALVVRRAQRRHRDPLDAECSCLLGDDAPEVELDGSVGRPPASGRDFRTYLIAVATNAYP